MEKEEFQNETYDGLYIYRGVSAPVWNDDYGQQKFLRFVNDPIFGTQDIGLGSFNINYEEDIEHIIDDKLDTIKRFPEYGGKLSWFSNAYGQYRDLQLFYRSRLVKVWVVLDQEAVNLDKIEQESVEILSKLEEFRLNRKSNLDMC